MYDIIIGDLWLFLLSLCVSTAAVLTELFKLNSHICFIIYFMLYMVRRRPVSSYFLSNENFLLF